MHHHHVAEFANRAELKTQQFNHVLRTVVQPNFQEGPWVAGGSVRRLISGQDPLASDVDVFFTSQAQLDSWLQRIRANFVVLSDETREHNTTLRVVVPREPFLMDEAGTPPPMREVTLQAIHIDFFDEPAAVIDMFDFTICQFITDGNQVLAGRMSLWDLSRKRLVIHRLTYGVETMRRLIKYTKQGFYACPGMMADFLQEVAADPRVIRADLVSID